MASLSLQKKSPTIPAKRKMVRLSLAVALLMPLSEAAQAQAVNCTQALRFDTIAACGGGGSIKITPKSGKVSRSGCAFPFGTPLRAVCSAKSFATSSSIQVKVSATTAKINGPASMKVKSFKIGTAAGGPTKTWTAGMLSATPLVFGIGGNLNVNGGQSLGSYSGNLVITVTFTPP